MGNINNWLSATKGYVAPGEATGFTLTADANESTDQRSTTVTVTPNEWDSNDSTGGILSFAVNQRGKEVVSDPLQVNFNISEVYHTDISKLDRFKIAARKIKASIYDSAIGTVDSGWCERTAFTPDSTSDIREIDDSYIPDTRSVNCAAGGFDLTKFTLCLNITENGAPKYNVDVFYYIQNNSAISPSARPSSNTDELKDGKDFGWNTPMHVSPENGALNITIVIYYSSLLETRNTSCTGDVTLKFTFSGVEGSDSSNVFESSCMFSDFNMNTSTSYNDYKDVTFQYTGEDLITIKNGTYPNYSGIGSEEIDSAYLISNFKNSGEVIKKAIVNFFVSSDVESNNLGGGTNGGLGHGNDDDNPRPHEAPAQTLAPFNKGSVYLTIRDKNGNILYNSLNGVDFDEGTQAPSGQSAVFSMDTPIPLTQESDNLKFEIRVNARAYFKSVMPSPITYNETNTGAIIMTAQTTDTGSWTAVDAKYWNDRLSDSTLSDEDREEIFGEIEEATGMEVENGGDLTPANP